MLGTQIKRLRLASGMNQVELAKMLGVSKQSISNWEGDNIVPSIEMLKKICDVFSCSADYLLGRDKTAKFYLDTGNMTMEQIAHISQLITDISAMNERLIHAGIDIHGSTYASDMDEDKSE